MKAFISAVVIAAIVAVGAAYVLNDAYQTTAYEAYATSGARVGDPGENLVEF